MLRIRLVNVTGSFKQADAVFADLSRRFASAPFDLETIAQGFTKVAAAGLDLEKTTELTNALVNAVAAFGGDSNVLERAFLGFTQVIGKGSLQMEELRQQIGESVPIAIRLMAAEADKTVPAFIDLVKRGMISSEEAVRLFTEGSAKTFGNFAELLQNTIGGALARIATEYKTGIARISAETTVDERIAVIFNNIADAVRDFLASLDEEDIKSFFSALEKWEPLITNLITAMGSLAGKVVTLGTAIAELLGVIPSEALEFGIIGYLFFGRTGAVVGAVVGTQLDNITDAVISVRDAVLDYQGLFVGMTGEEVLQEHLDSWRALEEAVTGVPLRGGAGLDTGFFGTPEDIEKTAAALAGIEGVVKRVADLNAPIPELDEAAIRKIESARERISDALRDITDKFTTMERSFSNDLLGVALAEINDKFGDTRDKIQDALAKAIELNKTTHAEGDSIATLNALLDKSNSLRDQSIERERVLFRLKEAQVAFEDQITRLQLKQQIMTLRSETDFSPGFNLASGTEGGRLFEQAAQMRTDLLIQIATAGREVESLYERLELADTGQHDRIRGLIEDHKELIQVSQNALAALSAEALAQQQLWQGVADVIRGSVTDAIYGLITGTQSLEDVGRQMFNALTRLAINYLMQLLEIWIMQQLMGLATGGVSTGVHSLVATAGFAKGGVFSGEVTPFGRGGVIQGPTLFGLAGEDGDKEAILPLTRIGGDLGVKASGSGGDTYNININAIDTQTGMEFLTKNLEHIQSGMTARDRLNRGARTRV
jgi:tape measure domain-containing protein